MPTATLDAAAVRQLAEWVPALGEIGTYAGGGLWRCPFTAADTTAKERLSGWMQELGLTPRLDPAGNLIGRLEGAVRAPVVLVGSHLDSVRAGGIYDGALGVLTGLVAAGALRRQLGQPRLPIEVVAICGEELSRFSLHFIGTRGITGQLTPEELHRVRDAEGVSVAEAMASCGLDAAAVGAAARKDIACFLELHIEQGPVLEARAVSTAVVTGIVGISQRFYTLRGEANHGGTTPMSMRKDALRGAARVIDQVPNLVAGHGSPTSVATVGIIEARPGGVSIVPDQVTFSVDVRDGDNAKRHAILAAVDDLVASVARDLGLRHEYRTQLEMDATPTDPRLCELLYGEANAAGVSCIRMNSGAGHDAMVMARHFPTAMLFVPSRGGKSHCPEEFTASDDILAGTTVLLRAMQRLAYGAAEATRLPSSA